MFPFERTEASLCVRGCALVCGVGHQVLYRLHSLHIHTSLGYGGQLAGHRRQGEAGLRQVLQDTGEDHILLDLVPLQRGTSDVGEWYPLTACLSILTFWRLDFEQNKYFTSRTCS